MDASDVNLKEYFRTDKGDFDCPHPTCKVISTSVPLWSAHLWSHAETLSGFSIPEKDKKNRCPHPKCIDKSGTMQTPLYEHIASEHLDIDEWVCPHLITWDDDVRRLCGFRTSDLEDLSEHRADEHSYVYNSETKNARAEDPWVRRNDNTLFEAPLRFASHNEEAEEEIEEVEEEGEETEEEVDVDDVTTIQSIPLHQPQVLPWFPPTYDPSLRVRTSAHYQGTGLPSNGMYRYFMGTHPHAHAHPNSHAHVHTQPSQNSSSFVLNEVRLIRTMDPSGRVIHQREERFYEPYT